MGDHPDNNGNECIYRLLPPEVTAVMHFSHCHAVHPVPVTPAAMGTRHAGTPGLPPRGSCTHSPACLWCIVQWSPQCVPQPQCPINRGMAGCKLYRPCPVNEVSGATHCACPIEGSRCVVSKSHRLSLTSPPCELALQGVPGTAQPSVSSSAACALPRPQSCPI